MQPVKIPMNVLRAMIPFVNPNRPLINCVHVEMRVPSHHQIVVATDSVKLLAFRGSGPVADPFEPFNIPIDCVIAATKVRYVEFALVTNTSLTVKDVVYRIEAADAPYPDWRRAIRRNEEKFGAAGSRAPGFLDTTIAAIHKVNKIMGTYHRVDENGGGPAIVRFSDEALVGVIMPLPTTSRTFPSYDYLPSWAA